MSKKTKILILGIGQSNFLNQLYTGILNNSNEFEFYINGYFDISQGKIEPSNLPYIKFLNIEENYPSKKKQLKSFLSLIKKRFFWQIAFFELSQNLNLTSLKKKLQEHIIAKYIATEIIDNLDIQAVHYHFCTPENLIFANYINKRIPSIASFWGSDLMRMTGEENVFYMRKALSNCSAITIQTSEMAEMFYCKYGREFYDKIHFLRFNLSLDIFKKIDALKNNEIALDEFKNRYIPKSNKYIVAIGHNAFQENNHINIIAALKNLGKELRNKITFIMHLSYGGNKKYIKLLKNISAEENNLDLRILTAYFAPEEMALLRISTDVMIQMPVSDALSAAMTEVLYAGNTVVTGSWLPYGILRRNGIKYYEVDSFKELPNTLSNLIDKRTSVISKNNNTLQIKNLLFPNVTTPKWIELFQSIFVNKENSN